MVFVDEAAELVSAFDRLDDRWIGGVGGFGCEQRERAVRAFLVVVRRVDAEDVFEVAAAEDQEPVEALGSDGADEALGVSVGLRRADRCVDHPDPFAAKDLAEGGGELAVAVVDQEPCPLE